MGKVRTGLSVSLDGFISGPNDGPEAPMGVGGERLLAWRATPCSALDDPANGKIAAVEMVAGLVNRKGAGIFGKGHAIYVAYSNAMYEALDGLPS